MTEVIQYLASWYVSDEYDQWIESATFDDLETAKRVAFKKATRHNTHLIAYVDIQYLGEYGYETKKELVNHHDSGKRWSRWIDYEKYKREN